MGFRYFVSLALGLLLASPAARAQQPPPAPVDVSQGAVTILTDGITNPNSPALRAMSEISLHLDKIGDLRVLPLMGYGGEANVRDLLKLRGADLALLNSDILAFLDAKKAYPEAREKIRYVTQLFDQKVYLFARKNITAIEQLAGKIVAVPGKGRASHITAATLFNRLQIAAKIVPHPQDQLAAALHKDAEAALVLELDLPLAPTGPDVHLLPIPMNKSLAKLYTAAKIDPADVASLPANAPVETIKVATLLAIFDWKKTHGRYPPVSRFISDLFAALPELRKRHPDSIWLETDVQANIPDWKRFSAADALRATVTATRKDGADVRLVARTEPAKAEPVRQEPPAQTVSPAPPVAAPGAPAIKVLISPRPPFADQEQGNGGLLGELASAALKLSAKERGETASLDLKWIPEQAVQLDTLLKDTTPVIGMAWDHPECDNPEDLGPNSVVLCDNAVMSDTLFQSVYALFTRADSDLKFKDDASLDGRTLCLPQTADIADLNRDNRRWASDKKVTLTRPASVVDCISMVEQGRADGVLMHELEGRIALQRLGLTLLFRTAERPIAVRSIHAIAAKNNPAALEIISRLNEGLTKLKQSGAYAEIVQKQLAPLWSEMRAEAAQ